MIRRYSRAYGVSGRHPRFLHKSRHQSCHKITCVSASAIAVQRKMSSSLRHVPLRGLYEGLR